MGRLGPLTSMALGRSPYEDVVYGEGEGDPRAPLQLYDERGRPVNPETKRVNKDIIRSHNEVMMVIGVVESNDTIEDLRNEHQRRHAHEQHDEILGRNLEWAARACELGGVWGVGGMRQRILLYRSYSHVPFSRLFQVERQTQSLTGLWLHGLPAFVASNALDFPWFADNIMRSAFAKAAFIYMQTSLKLWVFLQRTNLLPYSTSPWLPNWKFFVPLSNSSVIPPSPLPSSLGFRSVAAWMGSVVLSTTPFVAFYIANGVCQGIADRLYEEFYDALPNPSNSEQTRPPGNGFVLQRIADERDAEVSTAQAPPNEEPSPPSTEPSSTANVWDLPQTNDHPNAVDTDRGPTPDERSTTPPNRPSSPLTAPSRPRSHPRRSHTPNTDDFSSDDEATEEVVSATLISFDVENNPDGADLGVANDPNVLPGSWSAELRPNPAGSDSPTDGAARRPPRPRMYRDNALTQLPASLAAGIVARRVASLVLAPLEAASLRQVAWLWCRTRGRATDGLWEPMWLWPLVWRRGGRFLGWDFGFGAGFSWNSMVSLVGLELVHLLFDACLWSAVPLVVSRYLVSTEEWEKRQKAAELREQAQLQHQLENPAEGADGVQASAGSSG